MLSKTPKRKNLNIRVPDRGRTRTWRRLECRRGTALNRRHREWQEEQGLNVLFIALGFLHWVDEDEEPACSPVLLIPCDLTGVSPRDPFLLIGDESEGTLVNPTLRHKLETMAGIELPDIGETTVEGYLATVVSLVADHEGWCVQPAIVVATFPFSKLAMWEDLNLMISTGVTHPLVRRLAGDVDACIADALRRTVRHSDGGCQATGRAARRPAQHPRPIRSRRCGLQPTQGDRACAVGREPCDSWSTGNRQKPDYRKHHRNVDCRGAASAFREQENSSP